MEKAVGPVFLLAALTACLSQEVTVEISSDCFGTKTATVEFQTIQVDEGFNYNRNYIDEKCHDLYNATTLEGANVAECALNSYAAKMNSFSFVDNTCVGYPFWKANLTDCRLDEDQEGGILLYFADSKLSNYSACSSNFSKTTFGCVAPSSQYVIFQMADSACSELGASYYSAQSVEEFEALKAELLDIPEFLEIPAFLVNLHLVNGTWIWHGTEVEQPASSVPTVDFDARCARFSTIQNFLQPIECEADGYALCIIRQ